MGCVSLCGSRGLQPSATEPEWYILGQDYLLVGVTALNSLSPRPHVLLIDDDPAFHVILSRGLNLEGFDIRAVESTTEGVEVLDSQWPEILLLDVAMPGMDGITFCRLIRDRYRLPILMLTARDAVEHRVSGLNAGADDYLGKPFDLNELVARIRALLRRSVAANAFSGVQRNGPISIDPSNWTVFVNGEQVEVTGREFFLLATLMSSPGRVFSRDELLQAAWGADADIQSNTLEVHIANLRRKLEANDTPRVIATIRRGGYAFRVAG